MVKHRRDIQKLIKDLGLIPRRFEQHRSHYRVTVSDGEHDRMVVFPVSPSDFRWKINQERFLKREFNLA